MNSAITIEITPMGDSLTLASRQALEDVTKKQNDGALSQSDLADFTTSSRSKRSRTPAEPEKAIEKPPPKKSKST